MVERFHRSLKQALMCHSNKRWTETLPIVLLGLRSAFKEDLKCTSSELVYGTTIRLPADFIAPSTTTKKDLPEDFVQQLKKAMQTLTPTPGSAHCEPGTFVHRSLSDCSQVLVRHGGIKRSLQPPYDGPYQVLERTPKHFTVLIHGKRCTIGIDRLKPCFSTASDEVLTGQKATTSVNISDSLDPTPEGKDPVIQPQTITRSGRHVRFNPRYL
nr:uncharacterized protein LOC122271092 [Parasteatoda tepidariorum]